ncbi:MAG TPA: TonB-dependent receptor [Cyclobacteriaceae bacterium]|nr:TonB-dependent receptor [Cyclobacteriaceae bacterium]
MRKVIFTLVLANTVFAANAQNDSTRTLKEVVVSASRYDQSILETPRTVTVINSEVIRNSVYNSVGELLSRQSGIYMVGSNQTPGTNQSLFLRGSNSNQVVVMMDGVRITDPSSPNNAIDLSELSLTNVERIEVIEGAHSSMFGGGAVGGVINIITRKNGVKGLHGNGSVQGGTFGNGTSTVTTNANLSYNFNNGLYFNGSFYDQRVAGLNASTDTIKKPLQSPDKDGFRKTDGYAKIGYRKNKLDAFISFKRSTQHADIDAGAFADDDNAFVSFERNLFNYSVSYELNSKLKLVGNGSLSNSQRINENDSSLIDPTRYDGSFSKGVYNGRLNTNEIQLNYRSHHLNAVVGGGAFFEHMDFNTYYYSSAFQYTSKVNYDSIKTQATTSYGFAHGSWHGGNQNKMGIAAGARLSNHSLFGNFFTFDVNPSYAISSSSLLYGSISSGYNAPSLYQLFDPTKDFGVYTNRGNRSLNPEKTLSYEIGFKKEFNDASYFTVAAFETTTSNLIDYVYLWNKNTPIANLGYADYFGDTYINLSHQKVQGLELSGKWYILPKLSWSGNVTWLANTEITYKQSDIDANKTGGNHVQLYANGAFITGEGSIKNLTRRPSATGFSELKFQASPSFALILNYRLASQRSDSFYDYTLGPFGALNQRNIATYQLFDVGGFYRLNKTISLTAKVENVFNIQYQEILGYNTRGRSAYLRINFTW